MSAAPSQKPAAGRSNWILAGLVLTWSVAQSSLLRLGSSAPEERLANGLFLAGAAASLLAHELAQGAVARATRLRQHRGEAAGDPRAGWGGELWTAAAGPVASFACGLGVIALARVGYVAGLADPLIRSMAAVATLNVLIAAANCLPVLPLDGGRFLQASLKGLGCGPRHAARAAGVVTEAAALLILAAGLASALIDDLADALSWILLGVILHADGRAARRGAGLEAPAPAEDRRPRRAGALPKAE